MISLSNLYQSPISEKMGCPGVAAAPCGGRGILVGAVRPDIYGRNSRKGRLICGSDLLLAFMLGLGWLALSASAEEVVQPLRSDSQAPYVHRITLYDHDGIVIDPTDELAGPYSPRTTCGKCHDYATISHGWHFNASAADIDPGRPGEPWILVDPQTGTQLPISSRGWPGVTTPEGAGFTNWRFVLKFGHHTPGGGFGEPSDEVIQASPERLRWGISGKLEIDCMFCHSADQQHDPAEAARQIEKQNFKWSPTAALGLAVVRGEVRELPDGWDPLMPVNPNMPAETGPELIWDRSRFDADDRVFFNIVRQPPKERCYFCHSFREVGEHARLEWQTFQDVHITAGLKCVDCHRHGLDHMMVRGYEREVLERGDLSLLSYTCEGCHLGVLGYSGNAETRLGGHHGAPHPRHRGLPPLHFEKLSCTACHAGPWPLFDSKRFQTSLAHGLGLATRERLEDTPPDVHGPVFTRNDEGRIAPQRLVETALGMYSWSMAHNVRPATQALGVDGCTDCHRNRAAMFFGEVSLRDGVHRMIEFHGDEPTLANMWIWGFQFRTAFKCFGFICAAIVAVVLLRRLFADPPVSLQHETSSGHGLTRLGKLVLLIGLVGLLVNTVTGFGPKWAEGAVREWPLLGHMLGAPLFILGLTGAALLWSRRYRRLATETKTTSLLTTGQCVLFWLSLLSGFVVMSSMLVALLPILGYSGQEWLIQVHYFSALLMVIFIVLYLLVSLNTRRVNK